MDDFGRCAGFALYMDHETAEGQRQRIFPHTEVQNQFEGHGLASTLVRHALDQTLADGLTVVPVCPYVKNGIERHEDYRQHAVTPTPEHLQKLSAR